MSILSGVRLARDVAYASGCAAVVYVGVRGIGKLVERALVGQDDDSGKKTCNQIFHNIGLIAGSGLAGMALLVSQLNFRFTY